MHRKILIITGLIIILYPLSVSSQAFKKFTREPVKFIEELNSVFQNVDDSQYKGEGEKIVESFNTIWSSGNITQEQQEIIYNVCDFMLKRRMKPFPYFKNFLEDFVIVKKSQQTEDNMLAWLKSCEYMISTTRNFDDFEYYLEISATLFSDKSIFKSPTSHWVSSSDNFSFEFDTVPKIKFSSLDLKCYAKGDSICIYDTKGIFFPKKRLWTGKGGKVDWQRAGYNTDSVYAELGNYNIILKYAQYSADSVIFHHKKYFSRTLLGSLQDDILADKTGEDASYPAFDSYDKKLEIKNIFKDIDYEGGFYIKGAKIIGSGSKEKDAVLIFKKDGQKFIFVSSNSFLIKRDRISSFNAAATIYFEGDSIFHPAVEMKYMLNNNELSLLRSKAGISQCPFFDTFHKLEIYVEAMYWKMDEPKVELSMIKGAAPKSESAFESSNYYTEFRYFKLQGLDEVHPLYSIVEYSKLVKRKEFNIKDFAGHLNKSEDQIEGLIITINNMGFISYDIESGKITIKDKLYNYMNARVGKTDYDAIIFNSVVVGESNATLNLLNFDLRVKGVDRVQLSDSQSVYIYPTHQEIIVKKNRDFVFAGHVHAGLFDIYGKRFSFDYDKFKLDLPNIDSLSKNKICLWNKPRYK